MTITLRITERRFIRKPTTSLSGVATLPEQENPIARPQLIACVCPNKLLSDEFKYVFALVSRPPSAPLVAEGMKSSK